MKSKRKKAYEKELEEMNNLDMNEDEYSEYQYRKIHGEMRRVYEEGKVKKIR